MAIASELNVYRDTYRLTQFLLVITKQLHSVKLNKKINNKIRLWQEQELWEQLNLT